MTFLLDTNVVSEWVKPRPHGGVIAWLHDIDEDQVFLSVATLAELRHGIERLPESERRRRLDVWLKDALPQRFEDRILGIDHIVADAWGLIVARREAAGRPIGSMDAFIAATASCHALTVVTRNTADFEGTGLSLFNPWQEGG